MKRKLRATVAAFATVITIGITTQVYAEGDDTVPTTTEAPATTVTIKVEDASDTTQGPTSAPTTEPDTSVSSPTSSDAPVQPANSTSTTEVVPTSTSDDGPTTTVAAETKAAVTSTSNPNQNSSDQQTQVNGTQVAIVNSGDNVTANDPTNGSSQVPNNSIGSGAATAIGSDDTNIVSQDAQVVLTDQAVANILQAALIINIGAALANSGLNGVLSTPGGNGVTGAIDSGNATAIGNDMQQYITQAARAAGDANTDDAATQLAISLWMGMSLANSGTNSVTGTGAGGTGGGIGAGDATAIGNQSLTDIMQGASATGSGTSQINIEQYATVMNMGFALANSGINDISGVATGLLTAGDTTQQNDLALDLFSMLLPALLSSYATTGGSGQIGTGNATAIGNESETYVSQLAEATASGDGIASIIQSILVANVGAAGANTGGNSLGGHYADLNPEAAKAVVTLAAFLAQMLALVHTSSSNQAQALVEQGMEVPFGDIVLTIQGQLQGYDTTLTNESGARANVRQVTIILSLGIAQANSGLNGALGVNSDSALSATVGTNPDVISTGDVEGTNEGLVIICQRRNADDIECLAPKTEVLGDDQSRLPPGETGPWMPTLTPDPPGYVPASLVAVDDPGTVSDASGSTVAPEPQMPRSTVSAPGGGLPSTGVDMMNMLLFAGVVTSLGLVMTIARRRRESL